MPLIRARGRKKMRKKYKKTIKLSKVDEVWNDWVEIMIVKPLLEKGEVMLDKKAKLQIVGRRTINNKRAFDLLSRGLMARQNGGVKKATKINPLREDYTYKIELIEPRFKEGTLIFHADQRIKSRLHKILTTTNKYYPIV